MKTFGALYLIFSLVALVGGWYERHAAGRPLDFEGIIRALGLASFALLFGAFLCLITGLITGLGGLVIFEAINKIFGVKYP